MHPAGVNKRRKKTIPRNARSTRRAGGPDGKKDNRDHPSDACNGLVLQARSIGKAIAVASWDLPARRQHEAGWQIRASRKDRLQTDITSGIIGQNARKMQVSQISVISASRSVAKKMLRRHKHPSERCVVFLLAC